MTSTFSIKAQEQEIELDPVTVTSSLQQVKSSRTGRNIVVIKGEQLANTPVHSVDDLLRYVPGIEVQARGPMGAQSDFVIRGGTFQQVLVILDGNRINDPNTGHFTSYIPIAPAEIDRIEIVKGGSSAIYGSDAVGGVIHIITKTFAAKNKPATREFTSQVVVGENELSNINAGGFFNNGKTAIGGGILSNNTSGQPQRGTRGYVHMNSASLSFNQQIGSGWQVGMRSAYDKRDFSAQNFYTALKMDTASEEVKTFWNSLRVSYQKQNNSFSFDAGYRSTTDVFFFTPRTLPNESRSRLFQGLGVYEHRFSEKTILSTGAQYQTKSIQSNDRGNHNIDQAAAFVTLNQQVTPEFLVNPALRLDWHELGGTELIPQLSLSYRLHTLQLRANGGKTIRYADFTEQYNNYNKPPYVRSGNRIGNPALEAETSFSYEGGLDWFATEGIKLSATYFSRDYDKLIDYVLTPYSEMPRQDNLMAGGTFYLAKNIAQVTTKGVETDLLFQKKFNNRHTLLTNVGLVWLDSESENNTSSLYVSSHARYLANFTIRYATPLFAISTNGIYKKRSMQEQKETTSLIPAELSPSYFVMNVRSEVLLMENQVSLFGQVDNVFDRQYSDLLGAPMPGRWIMGGIRISLNK
ncbi:MAG TPA: TonB-dependent receptor [Chitinophagaceae bacterium]